MKHLLYLFLLFPFALFAQNPVTNQRVYDTIPFIPEHTTDRLAQFQKEPVTTGHIIFLGNSITEMGNWKKVLNDTTVINRGIGGDITYGILRRLKDITDRQPSKLFILCGINDIGKDIPDAVIADNMMKIVGRVHAACPQTKISLVLSADGPCTCSNGPPTSSDSKRLSMRVSIESVLIFVPYFRSVSISCSLSLPCVDVMSATGGLVEGSGP